MMARRNLFITIVLVIAVISNSCLMFGTTGTTPQPATGNNPVSPGSVIVVTA
jgi:hypothetical protein